MRGTGERRDILDIPATIMDVLVGSFLREVRFTKRDGTVSEYEPDSLTSLHRGIDRYLRENEYGYSLVTSPEFETSKKVLEVKRKTLKGMGKGNKPNRADPITGDEEEKMWEEGVLGDKDPETLQHTLYYIQGKCLGFRGSHESRQLCLGDLELHVDERGNEYLQWNERLTKTRSGQPNKVRAFTPKLWANDNKARCPIQLFKKFLANRPKEAMEKNSPFFLSVNHLRKDGSAWYKKSAMGESYLGKILKTMCQKAGVTGKKTNHSIRKTMCTNLIQAGVSPLLVQQLSGHENLQSLNNYGTASKSQQKMMCQILQNPKEGTQIALPGNGPAISAPPPPVSGHASQQLVIPSGIKRSQTYPNPTVQWSTMSHASSTTATAGPFSNAVIHGGTFNVNIQVHGNHSPEPEVKRKCIRRPVIESDSDSN